MNKKLIMGLVALGVLLATLVPVAVQGNCCQCINVDCDAYWEEQNTPVTETTLYRGVEIDYTYIPAEEHWTHARNHAVADAVHEANQAVIKMVINSHSAGRHIGLRGNKLLDYMMARINVARAENPLSGI